MVSRRGSPQPGLVCRWGPKQGVLLLPVLGTGAPARAGRAVAGGPRAVPQGWVLPRARVGSVVPVTPALAPPPPRPVGGARGPVLVERRRPLVRARVLPGRGVGEVAGPSPSSFVSRPVSPASRTSKTAAAELRVLGKAAPVQLSLVISLGHSSARSGPAQRQACARPPGETLRAP